MHHLLACLVVVAFGSLVVGVATASSARLDRWAVRTSLAMHFAFALALYWTMENVFRVSDVQMYLYESGSLRPRLEDRPVYWSIEIVKLIAHLPTEVPLDHGPTASMVGITALGMFLTGSIWAMFLLYAIVGFAGKWALYAALRDELEPQDSRPLAIAVLLIPSCVYWTSGLVKEAFALCGIGVLLRGAQLLLRGINAGSLLLLPLGFVLVGGFKPFFLFAFVIAFAVWALFAKVQRAWALAPFIFAMAGAVAVGGIALLGTVFTEFATDRVLETVAQHQVYGAIAEGGSAYQLGDPNARSLSAQLLSAPLALLTTLARPLPFEVHNATSAVASLELLVLTALLLRSVVRTGVRAALRNVAARPVLAFAFVFTAIAATAVGLVTTNFGTLSRYRAPVLPFYAALIVGIRAAERVRAPSRPAGAQPAAAAQGRTAAGGRRFIAHRRAVTRSARHG